MPSESRNFPQDRSARHAHALLWVVGLRASRNLYWATWSKRTGSWGRHYQHGVFHLHASTRNILFSICSYWKLSRRRQNWFGQTVCNLNRCIWYYPNDNYRNLHGSFQLRALRVVHSRVASDRYHQINSLGSNHLHLVRHNPWSIIRNHQGSRQISFWVYLYTDMLLRYRNASCTCPCFQCWDGNSRPLAWVQYCLHHTWYWFCYDHKLP